MGNETIITVTGNLTDDPELRFTPSGHAVANFSVASTPTAFNKQTNEWEDQETLFLRCSIWRAAAENVAESLQKGMRVIVQGKLKQRSYETREGEKRTTFELDVMEIGPSLQFATAKVTRANRQQGSGQQQGQQQPQGQGGQQPGQPQGGQQQWSGQQPQDPWGTPSEPPF